MIIHTVLTRVIRFFRSIFASLVSLSTSSRTTANDVESGVSESSSIAEIVIEHSTESSATVEQNEAPSSYYMSGRKPSRKASTVRSVKSRIVDSVIRNVRDERSRVLKEVVITPSSMLHIPCTAKVEIFPGPMPPSRAPISSALKVLKTSGERVVKLVRTPNFLVDPDPLPQANHPPRSGHSIEDIIELFPPPPILAPVEFDHPPRELNSTPGVRTRLSAELALTVRSFGNEEDCFSLSTSASHLSVTSGDTAATSPPTTPELAQMTRMISTANGIRTTLMIDTSQQYRPSLVSSVGFGCGAKAGRNRSKKQNSRSSPSFPRLSTMKDTKLDSSIVSPLIHDVSAAKVPEIVNFAMTQNCLSRDTTPNTPAENPETTTMAQADGETSRKDISPADPYTPDSGWRRSLKQVLQAFRDAVREGQGDVVLREACFSGQQSSSAVLQCHNTSMPSSRAQDAPSCSGSSAEGIRDDVAGLPTTSVSSEDLAKPISGGCTSLASETNHPPSFLRAHGLSTHLGPVIFIRGPRKEDYRTTIESTL